MPLLTPAQFLDELRKVQFKTFPTLTGKAVITGRGLNRKNGYNIVDHLGLVQLLRSLLMRFTILTRIFTEKKE